MTAGSGIIHQEMPKAKPRMRDSQIWLNLPKKYKMVELSYGDIRKEDMPTVNFEGGQLKIIAGSYKGTKGAFTPKYTPANYFDVNLHPNAEWELETDPNHTMFAYLFEGSSDFTKEHSGNMINNRQAVLFTHGDKVAVKAGENGVRRLQSTNQLHGEVQSS